MPRAPESGLPVRVNSTIASHWSEKLIAGLLARDDEVVAVAERLDLQVGGVGAATRFGQAQADDRFASHQPAVPVARQLGVGVGMHDRTHQRAEQLDVADIEIAVGHFLGDHPGGDTAQAEAAIFFGQVDADQAQRADFLHQARGRSPARPRASGNPA